MVRAWIAKVADHGTTVSRYRRLSRHSVSPLSDGVTLSLFGGELWLHGDGSFITGIELSDQLYGDD